MCTNGGNELVSVHRKVTWPPKTDLLSVIAMLQYGPSNQAFVHGAAFCGRNDVMWTTGLTPFALAGEHALLYQPQENRSA